MKKVGHGLLPVSVLGQAGDQDLEGVTCRLCRGDEIHLWEKVGKHKSDWQREDWQCWFILWRWGGGIREENKEED